MTKEELYKTIDQKSSYAWHYKGLLDQFFSQNVVIPKCENRHPYADVLHAWIEGVACEALLKRENTWKDISSFNALIIDDNVQYRIKPPEPVYEYLWYDKSGNTKWMTINEWYDNSDFMQCKETKRERK